MIFFFLTARERKSLTNLSKKIHLLERAQYALLDHSKIRFYWRHQNSFSFEILERSRHSYLFPRVPKKLHRATFKQNKYLKVIWKCIHFIATYSLTLSLRKLFVSFLFTTWLSQENRCISSRAVRGVANVLNVAKLIPIIYRCTSSETNQVTLDYFYTIH